MIVNQIVVVQLNYHLYMEIINILNLNLIQFKVSVLKEKLMLISNLEIKVLLANPLKIVSLVLLVKEDLKPKMMILVQILFNQMMGSRVVDL